MPEGDIVELLRAKFKGQDFAESAAVACRAALRDFPPVNLKGNLDASRKFLFPCGRLLLQSIVHLQFRSGETLKALNTTLGSVDRSSPILEGSTALTVAIAVCNQSVDGAWQAVENAMIAHASKADDESFLFIEPGQKFDSRDAYWSAYENLAEASLHDFGQLQSSLFKRELWSAGSFPSYASTEPENFSEYFSIPIFEFWRQWHAGYLTGQPLDWEFQRRVALIKSAIWDAGPEAVAAEIERIKAEMLSEQLPMAETIELNRDTGRFRAVPMPVENTNLMSALLSQIEDAMEDCVGSHNGLVQQSGDVNKLNRVLSKYRDDPQNAELTLTRVASSLRTQLHGSRELPDNEDNLALLNAVEEGVRGIRANHPEVAANREQLAQQAFKALSTEDKQLLENALPLLEEISEPELAEDFAADIPELINDALRPLPDGARPLPGADAATRVFSRVSKMALACEKSAKTFDSKEVKTIQLAHLGYTCLEFLYALVQVGLKALGVV